MAWFSTAVDRREDPLDRTRNGGGRGASDFYRHLSACFTCPLKSRCTPTKLRRIKRWENEDVLDRMQDRLDRMPDAMGVRRQTVEHPFGTLKAWMGATHFLTQTLDKVRTEMSLHVLAPQANDQERSGTADGGDQNLIASLKLLVPVCLSASAGKRSASTDTSDAFSHLG